LTELFLDSSPPIHLAKLASQTLAFFLRFNKYVYIVLVLVCYNFLDLYVAVEGEPGMDVRVANEKLRELLDRLAELETSVGDIDMKTQFIDRADTLIKVIFHDDESGQKDYLNRLHKIGWSPGSPEAFKYITEREWWLNAVVRSRRLVKSMMEYLELMPQVHGTVDEETPVVQKQKTNRVFIVHGHDEDMKKDVALFLYSLKLDPIVLSDEANGGFKSVMEKFEENAGQADFAIVLLSPDDVGYAKRFGKDTAKSRARQNVILELGYFIGKLGRENVIAFTKRDENGEPIEQPSDIVGGVIEPFEGNWQERIRKELKKAGYEIS
jgi:predicted nucleotide-binding protein